MSKKTERMGSVEVHQEQPTQVTFSDLSDWVLWQFPRSQDGWLDGAAHPPMAQYGWIPARIQPRNEQVILYAHCCSPLSTPEEAAEWIANQMA